MSPLHCCVFALFDTLCNCEHQCLLNNLYMLVKFAKAVFNHPKRVRLFGVVQKAMHGLPKCIYQEEQKIKEKLLMVRGTVKAAVLKGDKQCPDLVAASVYDTKPVHFLLMACKKMNGW